MIAWFHNLPIGWIAFLVFVVIYLVAGGIYWLVMALAVGERHVRSRRSLLACCLR